MEVNKRKLIVFLTHQNSEQNRNPNINNNFINKFTFTQFITTVTNKNFIPEDVTRAH